VGQKVGQLRILSAARPGDEIIDHVQRALMVHDHALQKQAVKLSPVCGGERGHLVGRQHARHERRVAGIGRNGRGGLAAVMGVLARAAMGAVSGM